MKSFFLFSKKGMTSRFFCSNIFEALPEDEIRYCGQLMTFEMCMEEQLCKAFETRKKAELFRALQNEAMNCSDKFAQMAMDAEEFGYTDY